MDISEHSINEAIEDIGELVSLEGGQGDDALDVVKDMATELKRLRAATPRGAVDAAEKATALAERYGEAIVAISEALPNVNRVRTIIAGLDPDQPTRGAVGDE